MKTLYFWGRYGEVAVEIEQIILRFALPLSSM
jgi:hypothetical protein